MTDYCMQLSQAVALSVVLKRARVHATPCSTRTTKHIEFTNSLPAKKYATIAKTNTSFIMEDLDFLPVEMT